jgi:NADH-quinone oxidoreductase subunit M
VNYGPVSNEKNAALPDLSLRERLVIVPIVAITVVMGVVPNLFLRPIEPSVQRIVDRVHDAAPVEVQASRPGGDTQAPAARPARHASSSVADQASASGSLEPLRGASRRATAAGVGPRRE